MTPKRYTDEQRRTFTELFGRNIRDFWCNFTGFNVVKFDEDIVKPADGVSTRQKLQKDWGDSAVTLVVGLMG